MADGSLDLVDLFSRVTALEQKQINSDQTLAAVLKNYTNLGVRVKTIRIILHEYRKCGDTAPLYAATAATDAYI